VLPAMERRGYDTNRISKDDLVQLLRLNKEGVIVREKVFRALKMISSGTKIDSSIFEEPGQSINKRDLLKIVEETKKIGLNLRDAEKRRSFLIGYIKKKTKNRAGGREISEVLCECAEKHALGEET
jgi:Glu-tRNA(Gln) amidotransferase subunit E-like FAD-binding protein